MNSPTNNYAAIVSRVMDIEEVTWGDPRNDFLIRFRGTLTQDLTQAKSYLTHQLRPEKLSPIIRVENGQTTILLVSDPLTSIVSQVFDIQDTTWAEPDQPHIVRYLGRLTRDSIEAYDYLAETLQDRDITPLFRVEEGQHAIILLKGVNRPKPSNPWVNLLMFLLTLISVALVGAMNALEGPLPANVEHGGLATFFLYLFTRIWQGWPFAASLLAILLAHEFGHYFAGRIHKTPVTLPYFIPFPFPPFGTLGAFIQLKAAPKNKRVLLDIGVAGPLAGFVVAIPILFLGLSLSRIEPIPFNTALQMEGNSILYLLAKYIVFGEWLPAPFSYGDTSPLLYWIRYFFTGRPLPLGGRDVFLHPVALAGWGGLLVTALNLIPAGQLDGGHLIFVLLGRKARRLLPYILVALFGLGFIWQGWWLWALIISFLGRAYAEPLDQITQLDSRRRLIAILGLVIFFLVFTPVPLQIFA